MLYSLGFIYWFYAKFATKNMLFSAFRMELSQEGGNVVNWSLSTNEKAPHFCRAKILGSPSLTNLVTGLLSSLSFRGRPR